MVFVNASHLPSRTKPTAQAKTCQQVCLLPTLIDMLIKLIERIKEAQGTTKAIRNAGNVLNMKLIAINKISGKLKI